MVKVSHALNHSATDAVRYMLTGNTISIPDRRHMLVDAVFNTILVAMAYHIPLTTMETGKPNRDTASIDPETGDEEIQSAGQQQVIVDITSVITEAKEQYDRAMLLTFPAQQVF